MWVSVGRRGPGGVVCDESPTKPGRRMVRAPVRASVLQPTRPPEGCRDDQVRSRGGEREGSTDAEADMLSAEASSAICVQRLDDSRNSAIHIKYRISLRSSSLREPRYPLLRVVCWLCARAAGRSAGFRRPCEWGGVGEVWSSGHRVAAATPRDLVEPAPSLDGSIGPGVRAPGTARWSSAGGRDGGGVWGVATQTLCLCDEIQ